MKKIILVVTMLAITACSSLRTNTDFDPSVSFAQFKTYAWIESKDAQSSYHLDGLLDQRVRAAVESQLSAKGVTPAPKESADLLVNYITKIDKKMDVDTFNSNLGYNPYYGPRWGLWGTGMQTQTTVREYEVGTLILDLIDRKTGQLVWRGTVADTVNNYSSPQERV